HLARSLAGPQIAPAVVYLRAVDPHPVHAHRVADHARAAAGKVLLLFQRRHDDARGIEENQVGVATDLQPAAVRYPILSRGIAGQLAHALFQRERPGLAYPVLQEMQAEARVAEIDEMRAGVRERDHALLVLEQRRDAGVVVLEQLGDELL